MKNYPNKEELQKLRNRGLTRLQIANKYGVSVSSVKDWLSVMGISKKFATKTKDDDQTANKNKNLIRLTPKALSFEEGLTLMEKAQLRLGDRMVLKGGYYYLDGRISSPKSILKLCRLN